MKPLVTLAVIMGMALVLVFSLAPAQQQPPAQGRQQPVQAQRPPAPPAAPGTVTFNTVITKLKNKQQVFCNNVSDPDTAAARKACEGQDYIWIEMQHSALTWREAQNLVDAVTSAGCIPFIRVPSANVGDIQKATDIGALGIVIPMVETVQEARNAVLFAKYPVGNLESPNTKPWGHRSSGGNHAASLWGPNYPTNANNNIFIMIQIESPAGVGMINNILEEVEGIDAVMVASNDFGMHAGDRDGSPTYAAREEVVRKAVLAHGKILAGPSNWANRPGYMLFQGRKGATTTGYKVP